MRIRTIKLDNFVYEIEGKQQIVGIITESNSEYSVILQQDKFSPVILGFLNS